MSDLKIQDVAFIVLYKIFKDKASAKQSRSLEEFNARCIKHLKIYLKNPKCKSYKSQIRSLLLEARKGGNVHNKLDSILLTARQQEAKKNNNMSDADCFWEWLEQLEHRLGITPFAAPQEEITEAIIAGRIHNVLLIDIEDLNDRCFGGRGDSELVRPMLITLLHKQPQNIVSELENYDQLNIQTKVIAGRISIFVSHKNHNLNCPYAFHQLVNQEDDEEDNGSVRLLQLYQELHDMGYKVTYYASTEPVLDKHAYVLQHQDFDSFDLITGTQKEPFDIVFSLNSEESLQELIQYFKQTDLFYPSIQVKYDRESTELAIALTIRLNPYYYREYAHLLPQHCKF